MSEVNLNARRAASSRLGLTQTKKMYEANAAIQLISIELHYNKSRVVASQIVQLSIKQNIIHVELQWKRPSTVLYSSVDWRARKSHSQYM